MRLSRPCYDKMHRCPGWAGGGLRYAKVCRCPGGSLDGTADGSLWKGWLWRFRLNRHSTCGVTVWPYAVRWLDWRWWTMIIRFRIADWWYRWNLWRRS